MKVLDPVGALGCVGPDEVLAVLTEAGRPSAVSRRRASSSTNLRDEASAPPACSELHVGSSMIRGDPSLRGSPTNPSEEL